MVVPTQSKVFRSDNPNLRTAMDRVGFIDAWISRLYNVAHPYHSRGGGRGSRTMGLVAIRNQHVNSCGTIGADPATMLNCLPATRIVPAVVVGAIAERIEHFVAWPVFRRHVFTQVNIVLFVTIRIVTCMPRTTGGRIVTAVLAYGTRGYNAQFRGRQQIVSRLELKCIA